MKLIEADEDEHEHEDKAAKKDAGGHKHEELDPHIWHDVGNAMHIVEVIRDRLAELDTANAE